MKKMMRSLFSLVLVMVMVMGLSTVAFATGGGTDDLTRVEGDNFTITVTTTVDNPGTFNAYQIFKGDLAQKGEDAATRVLSNITWGSSITDGDAALTAVKAINMGTEEEPYYPFEKCASAAAVAEVLSKESFDSPILQKFADTISGYLNEEPVAASKEGESTITVKEVGYYMIQSVAPTGENQNNYAATRYILAVVGNTTVTEKADVPSVKKKVQDINDTNSSNLEGALWQDSADWDIGDSVPFQLTGTLPSNYVDYETYKYVFHDTLSAGLTYKTDSIKVYVEAAGGTRTEILAKDEGAEESNYTIDVSGQNLTISFADLKKIIPDSDFDPESMPKIVVEYSATLNENANIGATGNTNEVYLEFSNNPNAGGGGETGTTPPDTVIVFTFELDVHKVEKTDVSGAPLNPLKGAGFTLYKMNASSGEYEPVYFKPHEVDSEGKADYYVVTEKPEAVDGVEPSAEIKGEDLVDFKFAGLDDGQYKLEETTVPAGYNKAEDIEFTITATHTDDPDPALTEVKFSPITDGAVITSGTGKDGEGAIGVGSTDVLNQKGSQLPSTGGIGTTIFYVIGSILVIVAIVLLVTKKRMSHQDQ